MKYYPNNIDQVLQKIISGEIKSLLLYGPDSGMISCFVSKIASSIKARISEAENEGEISSMLSSINMFGERLLIKIDSSIKLSSKLKADFTNGSHHFPIIIGSELGSSSNVRKFYEEEKGLGAIGCYPDDSRAISLIISQKCMSAKRQISNDALKFLSSSISGDRLMILSEIDKILLYTQNEPKITLEDCQKSVSKSLDYNPDMACIGYFAKNPRLYLKELDLLFENDINEIWIIRALARYCMNLIRIKLYEKDGKSIDEGMKMLRPPIFFKYVSHFKDIVARSSLSSLSDALDTLTQAEIEAKKGYAKAALDMVFLRGFDKTKIFQN
ncbi:MAG: DNA polymerase III subunit delta [Rickettsiaceae bacterium]|nr:DNA polymerase III subunit delta [Rickettsiaceae bacterium]